MKKHILHQGAGIIKKQFTSDSFKYYFEIDISCVIFSMIYVYFTSVYTTQYSQTILFAEMKRVVLFNLFLYCNNGNNN